MNYKIYIESCNNFPIGDWGVSALQGFRANQADIIFFEDIEEVPKSPWNIIVACIESTNKYLERFGLGPKMAINIPKSIESYAGRKIWYSTMGEFRSDPKLPVFVKPNGRAKEFVAGVVNKESDIPFIFKDIKDDCPVLLSTPVNFVSEYRVYVTKGEIKGIYWYSGDFFKFPNSETIKACVNAYKDAPDAYGIDFGIARDGYGGEVTLLVEVNDAWSLGNYGLEHTKYSKLLATRWRQLMKEAGYNV